MDRVGTFIVALLLLVGCGGGGRAPTPTPSAVPIPGIPFLTPEPTRYEANRPSGSCIFTLDISNETSYLLRILINGVDVRTVEPQGTLRLTQIDDRLPLMPWDVLLVKASDGQPLVEASYTADEVEGYLVARDGEASRSSRDCAPA